MKTIKDIIGPGIYEANEQMKKIRFFCTCTPNEFHTFFLESIDFDFEVDDNNKEIINQLYFWLTRDDRFDGDFEKGIMLIGAIGSGKTVIMDAFCHVIEVMARKIFEKIQSSYTSTISIDGLTTYYKRPIFIDDIGKEPLQINNYGSEMRPFEDLLDNRYRNKGITFGTSNLKLEDMPYIGHTKDRIKQMFNIIVLPGKSRRN